MGIRKLFVFLLSFLIIFNISNAFANQSITELPIYIEGKEAGKIVGALDGDADAVASFENNNGKSYTYVEPLKVIIINKYGISSFDELYKEGFYTGYIEQHKQTYNKVFFEMQLDRIKAIQNGSIVQSDDYKSGFLSGSSEGTALAINDAKDAVVSGSINNYSLYMPTDSLLIVKYALNLDTPDYMNGFLKGYKDGYKNSFTETFRKTSLTKAILEEEFNLFMEGGTVSSLDKKVRLVFEPATVYLDNSVEIKVLPKNQVANSKKPAKVRAARFYEIVVNKGSGANIYKPVKLEFDYTGTSNVGIYNDITGKYMDTYVENNKIYTYITPSNWNGGVYTVYIDTDVKLNDKYTSSPFSQELIYLRKNNIILANVDLKGNVTKGQFLYYVGKALGWEKSPLKDFMYANIMLYKDSASIKVSERTYVKHALTQGYIKEFEDKTLRTNDIITFKEMEEILKQIKYDYSLNTLFESALSRGMLWQGYYEQDAPLTYEMLFKSVYDIMLK